MNSYQHYDTTTVCQKSDKIVTSSTPTIHGNDLTCMNKCYPLKKQHDVIIKLTKKNMYNLGSPIRGTLFYFWRFWI